MSSANSRGSAQGYKRHQIREENYVKEDLPGQVDLPCLKAKEAAEFLGIDRDLLWLLKDAGVIPYFQLRPRSEIFYPVVGLEQWQESNRHRRPNGGCR